MFVKGTELLSTDVLQEEERLSTLIGWSQNQEEVWKCLVVFWYVRNGKKDVKTECF